MDTATKTRPRFRNDLVAQPIEDKGQVFVDVTDPDTGTTFRFYEIEYSVACAMDGARDLPELRAWARDEIGVEPTVDELTTVIATLDELGYLDRTGPSPSATIPGGAQAPGQHEVELGQAGLSPARSPRELVSAEELELGHAGAGAPAQATVPATSGAAAETSFDGLLDDEASSEMSRAGTSPFARTGLPIQADEAEDDASPTKPALRMGSGEALRDRARQTDDEDGPTNIPAPASQFDEDEVSVDLSDHLSIGTDDVKEAVRQSRVMKVPEALVDAAPPKPAEKAEKPAASKAEETATKAASKSAELAAVAQPKDPLPAESGSGLRVALLVILLLVALGAGAYYAYAHLGLFGGGAEASAVTPADAAAVAEPERPTAVLSEEEVEPAFLEASEAGEVAWLVEAGEQVAEGDELVRFSGYDERAEALERLIGEEAQLQDALDQATAEDDRRRMRRIEGQVEQAQGRVAEAEAALASHRLLAPRVGIFEPEISAGDSVEAGDSIGVIAAAPRALAVFETDNAAAFTEGQSVTVASEGAGEVASCEVIAGGAMTITVACPQSSPFGPGDTVVLSN
jgi:hypothetical protein